LERHEIARLALRFIFQISGALIDHLAVEPRSVPAAEIADAHGRRIKVELAVVARDVGEARIVRQRQLDIAIRRTADEALAPLVINVLAPFQGPARDCENDPRTRHGATPNVSHQGALARRTRGWRKPNRSAAWPPMRIVQYSLHIACR